MRTPYRVGKGIYLRPFDPTTDTETLLEWVNDPEVMRYTSRYRPMTAAQQAKFFTATESDSVIALAVVRTEDDRLIGSIGLHDIDLRSRNCWYGIMIGDKSAQNKGHGTEATRLILKVAFDTLNLHRVYLYVYEYNTRGIHVYEKLGFRVEGRMRQDTFCEGRYWDTIVMGILREEWEATQLTARRASEG